jgi:hypothetical protein
VEVAVEFGQVVIVGNVVEETIDFSQGHALMERHLCLRSTDVECSVPGTTIWAIEPAPFRLCMGKSRINHTRVWNAGNELLGADTRKKLVLCQQAIIRGVVKFEDVSQVVFATGNECKNAVFFGAVLRLNKAMGVVAPDARKR